MNFIKKLAVPFDVSTNISETKHIFYVYWNDNCTVTNTCMAVNGVRIWDRQNKVYDRVCNSYFGYRLGCEWGREGALPSQWAREADAGVGRFKSAQWHA